MEIFLKIDAFYRLILILHVTYWLPHFLPIDVIFFNGGFSLALKHNAMPKYSCTFHLINGFENKAFAG